MNPLKRRAAKKNRKYLEFVEKKILLFHLKTLALSRGAPCEKSFRSILYMNRREAPFQADNEESSKLEWQRDLAG